MVYCTLHIETYVILHPIRGAGHEVVHQSQQGLMYSHLIRSGFVEEQTYTIYTMNFREQVTITNSYRDGMKTLNKILIITRR